VAHHAPLAVYVAPVVEGAQVHAVYLQEIIHLRMALESQCRPEKMGVRMYTVKIASTRAYTRAQARGATPELRRVADTTPNGLSTGRHSIHTTVGSHGL